MSMTSEPSSNSASSTNPLGGPAKHRFRQAVRRQWSGYVALVRVCSVCGHENRETDLFCTGCARDIRGEPVQSSEDDRAGVDLLNRRLAQEERQRSRTRAHMAQGGGGWIFVGLLLVVIAVAMATDPVVRFLVWLAGIALGLLGIWQIRRDGSTLRAWGYILTSIAAALLVLIGVRALTGQETAAEPEIVPIAVATPGLSTEPDPGVSGATPPGDGITGEVTMYRGGPEHAGQLPGPPPATAPRIAWRFDTGGEVYSSPAITNGILYVASKDGLLFALDAHSGTERWRFRISEYVTRSSPAVINGTVYIGGGFGFHALDAITGQPRWSVPIQYAGQASPTVANGTVLVTSQEGWIYALDATTGETVWRTSTDGLVFGAPAIIGDQVIYATDTGVVNTVELETGRLIWRATVAGAIFASPVASQSSVVVTTQAGTLVAFNRADGSQQWSFAHGGSEAAALSDPLVVLSASDGGVYGIDPAGGEQRWAYPTGKRDLSSPVIAGDVVLTGAGDTLLALDSRTGAGLWYFLAGDVIETSPVVVDGYVFFGSRDGFVYAVTDR